ncbi:SAM-dependent methyltransferase [Embleya sp. NPDC008237]|uniref:SAM-dependent methyltransferase n=1 Tax=unclassified Embleya TaxID=2699296 RepID=UPI0036F03FEF
MSEQDWAPTGIDVSRPHPARVYDYHIGGKTNYPVDRELAERFIAVAPQTSVTALDNRAFLGRAVRYAAEQGIDQFLDIGTGIPAPGNTHEVAQEIIPSARVAYVDNDPIVLAHARALMPATDRGRTSFTMGDVREPEKILAAPEVREVIDFERPVALLLVAILHYVSAAEDPAGVVNRLLAAVPSGSLLIASHTTSDFLPPIAAEQVLEINADAEFMLPRPHAEIASFLTGVELVEPGLVQAPLWRPEEGADLSPERLAQSWIYTAVGRKV